MLPEKFYEIGFVLIASTVLTSVLTGCVFWVRWFRGTQKHNLCGDVSTDLVTELPQPRPRWTVFDFFLMFGVMILVGVALRQPTPEQPQQESAAAQSTAGAPANKNADDKKQVGESQTDENKTNDNSDAEPQTLQVAEQSTEEASGNETAVNVGPRIDADETAAPIDSKQLAKRVQNHFFANLVSFIVVLLYLRLIHGATLSNLSLIPTRKDFRRGLVATIWILTPVLLINVIMSNLVAYEHPVTDLLAEESGTTTFIALFCSAALLTPIVEEFQFRLLLQGGLQQITDPPAFDAEEPNWRPKTLWPIFVTSLLFSLMHLGQGAAPIPLFFLSVGLGFLYQRTGRLVPVIVVHMLLNGATMCMEFCRVNAGL